MQHVAGVALGCQAPGFQRGLDRGITRAGWPCVTAVPFHAARAQGLRKPCKTVLFGSRHEA